MEPTYNFPVLRGIQAGREYYLTMCALKLVPRIFAFDEEEIVPPELRAQRTLNKSRVPEITKYITENPKEYVFSALTASINGETNFTPLEESDEKRNVGWLSVPMEASIIINDGQHRRAAIVEALKERPELSDETIAVVFFVDAGLRRSQQMFADLNKHAVRPSRSIGVLYDHRDPIANLARTLMIKVPLFKDLTEKEKTSISNRSPKLFTLSGIYQATKALLQKSDNELITVREEKIAIEFWTELGNIIPEWRMASKKEISCAHLREEYIHAHGVALLAIGIAGGDLLAQYPKGWRTRLQSLNDLDWSRSNTNLWEGRAMLQGKISKRTDQVILTANLIKKKIGIPLRPNEQKTEQVFLDGRGK